MIMLMDLLNWAATIFVWGFGTIIALGIVLFAWACLVNSVIYVGYFLGLWRKDGMSHARFAKMQEQYPTSP
jgi:hypothetical protein